MPVLADARHDPEDAFARLERDIVLPGTRVQVFAVDPATGSRKGDAVHSKTVGADGFWGPFAAAPGTAYEFVVEAPGYAITHIYRSPFPRGTALLHMRPERLADADSVALVRGADVKDAKLRAQLLNAVSPGLRVEAVARGAGRVILGQVPDDPA